MTSIETTENTSTCPSWCLAHEYDEDGGPGAHQTPHDFGLTGPVFVEQVDVEGQPHIYANDVTNGGIVTAAQARKLAHALLAAAEDLDEITGADQ